MQQIPSRIGQYRIERQIGKGIANVFLARHPRFQYVALKVLRPSYVNQRRAQKRFLSEVQILKRLRHPHIIRLYEAGTYIDSHGGLRSYLATEYYPDGALHHLLAQYGGRLPEHYALSLAVQIADALCYAHSRGIIHRDIKPSNVLLSNNRTRAILADFNIARDLGVEGSSPTVGILGTLAYMSPEQTFGNREFVRRGSDIYSFGVVLYEMLSGYQPRNNTDMPDVVVVQKILQEPLPPVQQIAPHVSPQVAAVVDRCVQPRREHRYETMDQVAAALRWAGSARGYSLPTVSHHSDRTYRNGSTAGPWVLMAVGIGSICFLVMLVLILVLTSGATIIGTY
jgi:serine/threonine protein kinase